MNFNWEEFKKGNIKVYCKTKDESIDFTMDFARTLNNYFSLGTTNIIKDNVYYQCCGDRYIQCDYIMMVGDNWVEWSDYMEQKNKQEMTYSQIIDFVKNNSSLCDCFGCYENCEKCVFDYIKYLMNIK